MAVKKAALALYKVLRKKYKKNKFLTFLDLLSKSNENLSGVLFKLDIYFLYYEM